MPKQLVQRDDAADRDVPGWHELEVANPSFLVEKLGAECSDTQGLRELTVNAMEAIAALGPGRSGSVVWDLDWERADASRGRIRKLSITDTGIGMSPDAMRYYINHLAATSHEQGRTKNYGVGAKVAAGSRNPHGLEYRSWHQGGGALVCFKRDPNWTVGPRAAAMARRATRLLAPAEGERKTVGTARTPARHPGGAPRPARARRHHAGAQERDRSPPVLGRSMSEHALPAAA